MKYQTTNRIDDSKKWYAFSAVMITMFFSSMDQTVVSTAMPTIIGELKGFSVYAWVFTAYMMASAVTVPIYGKLSDIYGRKPFYAFGLILFMVGSIFSGIAKNIYMLIAARAIQGIGAGAMMSMPRATIGDMFNPRERGKWMGILSSTYGIASIIGPFLGGWITDHIGWRWIFYINLPVGIIALITVLYALPDVRINKKVSLDLKGTLFLIIGLIPILIGFTLAGDKLPWSSYKLYLLFGTGLIFLFIFYSNEKRVKEPIILPELFKNEIFNTSLLLGLFVSIGMFGALMFLPLFIQVVVGLTPQYSGIVLTPMMLSFIIGSIIGGQLISRTGKYKFLSIIGTLIMITGSFLLFKMNINTTWNQVLTNMVVLGIGIGMLLPLLSVVVQNAFPYKIMGVVNSTQQFVRSLGGVVAAPILGTVMNNSFKATLKQTMPAKLKNILTMMPQSVQKQFFQPQAITNKKALEAMKSKFMMFGEGWKKIYEGFIVAIKKSIVSGFTHLFTITIIFSILALCAALVLKEIPLKKDDFYNIED